MYRAQPVDAASAPGLYRLVADLAARDNLPMPRVYIIPDDSPNAFATGRNPAHAGGGGDLRDHAPAQRRRACGRDRP